jgi:hypothetical protein
MPTCLSVELIPNTDHSLYRSVGDSTYVRTVVPAEDSRRILEALVSGYPEQGVIFGVRLRAGWGDTLQVDVETCRDPYSGIHTDRDERRKIREALLLAVPDSLPMVRVEPFGL